MLYDDRQIRRAEPGLLLAVAALLLIGLLAIYSATYGSESPDMHQNFSKQLISALIGIFCMAAVYFVPLRFFYERAFYIYLFSIVLLILVLIVGAGGGPSRWFNLGAFSLQPAEIAKFGAVLAISRFLSYDTRSQLVHRDVLITFLLMLLPFALILRQPDLGSALVLVAVILPILHWAGLAGSTLFVLIAPIISLVCAFNFYSFFAAMLFISIALFLFQRSLRFFLTNFVINIGVGVITPALWKTLQAYQQDRILAFLGLVSDPHGLGYQVIQSKVAIGSGGLFGKGFLQGTQTQLRFLPEQHTDFIFSVVSEEFGFLGSTVVLCLFLYVLYRGISIAASVKSGFASLLAFGITMILLFQVFVNIGMTMAIMPVTGLPLPFLSYGGSALVMNLIFVGLLLNLSRNRFEYI